MVGFECTGKVLEEVARVELGVFHGLKHDDPPLQRNGQRGEFEVGAERATVAVNARERPLRQGVDLDGLAVGQVVECLLPLVDSTVSGCKRLADGVRCRVESKRDTEPALVEEDGSCLVDGVAAAIKFAALVIQALFVQLLEKFRDVLDGLLALLVGISAQICVRPSRRRACASNPALRSTPVTIAPRSRKRCEQWP